MNKGDSGDGTVGETEPPVDVIEVVVETEDEGRVYSRSPPMHVITALDLLLKAQSVLSRYGTDAKIIRVSIEVVYLARPVVDATMSKPGVNLR